MVMSSTNCLSRLTRHRVLVVLVAETAGLLVEGPDGVVVVQLGRHSVPVVVNPGVIKSVRDLVS